MSLLLEFSMWPMGKGESVGSYVAQSLDTIDRSGVSYRLNAMGTILEGEWEEVMPVVEACFRRMQKDCRRITCTMKIDWRQGATGRLDAKVSSVEERLGRPLQH